nr:MAG TPA: hypothetical protein [Caudoviricetes sp.]
MKKVVFKIVFIARIIERTSPRAFFIAVIMEKLRNCRYKHKKAPPKKEGKKKDYKFLNLRFIIRNS